MKSFQIKTKLDNIKYINFYRRNFNDLSTRSRANLNSFEIYIYYKRLKLLLSSDFNDNNLEYISLNDFKNFCFQCFIEKYPNEKYYNVTCKDFENVIDASFDGYLDIDHVKNLLPWSKTNVQSTEIKPLPSYNINQIRDILINDKYDKEDVEDIIKTIQNHETS